MNYFGKIFTAAVTFVLCCTNIFAQEQNPADTAASSKPAFPENAPMMRQDDPQKLYYIRDINIHGVQYLNSDILKSSAGLIAGDSIYLPSNFIANMSEQNRIPQHVAIIMDGNGRWAELRGKERYEGHVAGVEPVRASLRAAARWGVKYLTLYAFSTENWGRPAQEVDALMELFCKSVVNETPELIRQGVEIRMIGDRTRFSEKVQRYLCEAEQRTAGGKTLTLILALNYSSRSEITRAVQRIAARVAAGELAPEEISEGTVSASLDTAPYPNPDLVVRTSGECRLSNFLLWQASYAELYFPEVLWPDFTEEEFDRAMEEYARRDRRFGLVK